MRDKDSEVNIQIVTLEDEYKYSETDEIVDELLYSIEKQNTSYKLLTKEKDTITKNKYDGYKMLYENGNNQVYVAMGKASDKVLLVTYEATNSYFDILLDSVQNIIYDFKIIDSNFKLSHKIDIKEGSIKWNNDGKLKDLSDTYDDKIASNNYEVEYAIPKNFKSQFYYTNSGTYEDEGLEKGNISIEVHVNYENIYECLDKDNIFMYKKYKDEREGKDGEYLNFKEDIEETKEKGYVKYIYKNSYDWTTEYLNQKCENVYIIYEVDKNHCISFEIVANDVKIPKELIDNIKIKSVKNYASYIKRTIADDKLIGILKDFVDYEKEKTRTITLKLPTECIEIDINKNMYEDRYYGINYHEDYYTYDYNISYQGRDNCRDMAKSLNYIYIDSYKKNGKYVEFTEGKDITLHGNKLKLYTGGCTAIYGSDYGKLAGTKYYKDYKALVYQYSKDDNECLTIVIAGNDVKVSDSQIEQFANFDIEVK